MSTDEVTIAEPLEKGAWIPVTDELHYAHKLSAAWDRRRAAEQDTRSNSRPRRHSTTTTPERSS